VAASSSITIAVVSGQLCATKGNARGNHDSAILESFVKLWSAFNLFNKWMLKIFWYLNRFYVPHNHTPTLQQHGINIFAGIVFTKHSHALKECIERSADELNKSLLLTCVDAFHAVGKMDSFLAELVVSCIRPVGAHSTTEEEEIALSLLAKLHHIDGIGRLCEKPQLLKKLVDCSLASPPNSTTTLRVMQVLFNLTVSGGLHQNWFRPANVQYNHVANLGKFKWVVNCLIQHATRGERTNGRTRLPFTLGSNVTAGETPQTLALRTLAQLGVTQRHLRCFCMLTMLSLAGDAVHGVKSSFYRVPTALLWTIHETLCPYARKVGPSNKRM
jgi:hypothetical protein